MQVFTAARRAARLHRRLIAAVVADQAVLAPVIRQRDRAVYASFRLSAASAKEEPGIAAPIQEEHGLLTGSQLCCHLLPQAARDRHLRIGLPELFPHVDDLHT